jgi:hypothetical protein
MTGIRLELVTDSQPDLPQSRPAEERAETMDVNHLSLLALLTCVQLLGRLLSGAVFGRPPAISAGR